MSSNLSSVDLSGMRVAALATDGVEQVELTQPVQALRDVGAEVVVISLSGKPIKGFNQDTPADTLPVDRGLDQVSADEFDGLLLPGGVANPDKLRTQSAAVAFVRAFTASSKPVAAICHGPWTLIETGHIRGRTITSWPSLKTDLTNAGATWVDEEVAVDGSLITSRKPDDIPAFNRAFIRMLEAKRRRRAA